MAIESTLPPASENRAVAAARGIPGFYRAVMIEMKQVTWPEVVDVRRATIASLLLVLLPGRGIFLPHHVPPPPPGRPLPRASPGPCAMRPRPTSVYTLTCISPPGVKTRVSAPQPAPVPGR